MNLGFTISSYHSYEPFLSLSPLYQHVTNSRSRQTAPNNNLINGHEHSLWSLPGNLGLEYLPGGQQRAILQEYRNYRLNRLLVYTSL